ncbi:MAG: DUF2970 domain-containing protein [Gammaproteobacteria bacterium]|nr:DUF2970 domain-containing protein [Gammaproteobacteria bacterium]MDH5650930.1 DUF2970 domain-containing protein [Gammaproteobacteria bacterium]
MSEEQNKQTPSLWQVAQSVMAALFGVQSSKNYERDFKHGKPSQYIILGLIGVAIFIGTILGVVMLVMKLAVG